MKLTDEMLDALRDIIKHKIAMWDASNKLEKLAQTDIDTSSDEINDLAAGTDDVMDIDKDDLRQVLLDGCNWGPIEQLFSDD